MTQYNITDRVALVEDNPKIPFVHVYNVYCGCSVGSPLMSTNGIGFIEELAKLYLDYMYQQLKNHFLYTTDNLDTSR